MKLAGNSLQHRFRRLSIKWSLIGLALTLFVVLPCLFLVIKHSSEREVEITARALTRAFRPMILSDQVRDAILQMQTVAKLKSGESVEVLEPNFNPVYTFNTDQPTGQFCKLPNYPCWLSNHTLVSVLQPVYFDDDSHSQLYGYVSLTLNSNIDFGIILLIVFVCVVFLIQIIGIYSGLRTESKGIETILSKWKAKVDNPKTEDVAFENAELFSEFHSLNSSIKKLHKEIRGLEEKAAESAAAKAKIDIVRGISHDLKTPLSQISKFFEIFVNNVRNGKEINGHEVERIKATMKRMGALIRQVSDFDRRNETRAILNLAQWCRSFVEDVRLNGELQAKSASLGCAGSADAESTLILINEDALFRVLDNLVRNSIDALPEKNGKIEIRLTKNDTKLKLSISDNGCGIPLNIQDRIFDLDFTTKQSRGTGLGLSIVKKICDEFKLGLSVSSAKNVGTTFTIEIPIAQVQTKDFVFNNEETPYAVQYISN